ncbi:MAG: DNA cytosine methyltransferase [Dehalococcoidia bacterium]
MRPSCVSLFSGCGGLDWGLREAGFNISYATDLEPLCGDSHKSNFGEETRFEVASVESISKESIQATIESELHGLELLVGGPPCPPYSKSRFYRKEKPRGLADPVGDATLAGYLRLLEELKPRAFLFENVPGFSFKVHRTAVEALVSKAHSLGYSTAWEVINAADYGVPQIRKRFFMVGMLDRKFKFPKQTHRDPSSKQSELFSESLPPWVTAGEVINDLDTPENACDAGHFAGGKHHDLLREVPPGDNYLFFTKERGHPEPKFQWRSRYWSFLLKLSPDMPSWTIQARRSNNMGPLHWRNRILRIEEVKRLQTFPDHFQLAGTLEQQWRQVGNAVPPLMAEVLGKAILSQLEG